MSPEQFMSSLLRRIGLLGLSRAQQSIPSRTLKKAVNSFVDGPDSVRIQVPHYWAIYVHDGRSAPFTRTKPLMVWFPDPNDDPRLNSGVTPVRASQLKRLRLSKEEFARLRKAGILVVRHTIHKPTPPTPFFGNGPGEGMHGFVNDVDRVVDEEFSGFVRNFLDRDLQDSDSVTLRL